MSQFVLEQQNQVATTQQQLPKDRIRRLVWKMAIATLILMAIGSATRVMNAGLACPDWPLCYGEIVPTKQMNFQVFLEWFHRLDASLIGVSAIVLVGMSWWSRQHLPKWLPWASIFALFLIVFQGILGGLTVTQLLRFDIVTAHLGTALFFFITLLVIGTALTPYKATGNVDKLPVISFTATLLVYLQSLLGALVGSRWALHQCFGGSQLCSVMYTHIFGLIPPTLATLALVFMSWRSKSPSGFAVASSRQSRPTRCSLHPALRKLANYAGGLLILQIILGFATFRLHLQVEPLTVTHQAIGATLLGVLVVFTVLSVRDWMDTRSISDYNQELNSSATSDVSC